MGSRTARNTVRAVAATGVAIGLTVSGLSVADAADGDTMVALGDSYASGVGSRDYYEDSGDCYRSPKAYSSLIASANSLALDFQACSGAVTQDVRGNQVQALSSSTDFVSITIGGNDVDFAPVLTECAKPGWWGDCDAAIDGAIAIMENELPGRLDATYGEIATRAPGADVVVTGYPILFNGEDCNAITFFSPEEEERLNDATEDLNALIEQKAGAAGFTFADVRSAFAGHAVCDDVEYVNGASMPIVNSYHPNVDGHAAYASVVGPALGLGDGSDATATTAAAAKIDSSSRNTTTAGGFAFTPPDLNSLEAQRAARAAGVSQTDLHKLQRAQASGVSSSSLNSLDQRITAKANH